MVKVVYDGTVILIFSIVFLAFTRPDTTTTAYSADATIPIAQNSDNTIKAINESTRRPAKKGLSINSASNSTTLARPEALKTTTTKKKSRVLRACEKA